MPKRIQPIQVEQLENPDLNKQFYKDIFESKKYTYLHMFNGLQLYQKELFLAEFIVGMNREKEMVDYYVYLKIGSADWITQKWIQQKMVWCNIGNPSLRNLPTSIIFEYVLPKYNFIMTDQEQSFLGERLWLHIIALSYSKNYNVYYIDFVNKTINKFNTQEEFNTLIRSKNSPWGDTDDYKLHRIVISKYIFN
jgi:hypothetical protein